MMLRLRKSDLHFHSMRDISYKDEIWNAKELSALDEWADDVIAYCREIGLNLISVTDHNDYWASLALKDAIQRAGAIDEVWLIGGMEITSKDGLQAIVYFDLDYYNTPEKLSGLCGILGIVDIPTKDITEKRQCVRTTMDLDEIINQFSKRADSDYILICPVVDGDSGLIKHRNGKNIYVKDEIVGGIVSQNINNVSGEVINGKDAQYGEKSIGVLVTSDSRKLRASNGGSANPIGSAVTWLKISEPKCRALRQTLISGRDKRLFYSEPTQPYNYVSKLVIENSAKFDSKIEFEFHREYTTLIGGRGTGKSLALYALMKVLGQDERLLQDKDDDWFREQSIKYAGLFVDGAPFPKGTIIRAEIRGELNIEVVCQCNDWNSFEYSWRMLDSGNYEQGFPDTDVVRLCQFVQGELSEIGRSPARFKEMLLQPIQDEQKKIQERIRKTRQEYATKIKLKYEIIARSKALEEARKKEKPLIEQTKSLRETFQKDLTPEEKAVLGKSQTVKDVTQSLSLLKKLQQEVRDEIDLSILSNVTTFETNIKTLKDADFINKDWKSNVEKLEKLISDWQAKVADIKSLLEKVEPFVDKLEQDKQTFDKKLNRVQDKVRGQEELKLRLGKLENELTETKSFISAETDWLKKFSNVNELVEGAKKDWSNSLKERGDLLEQRAKKIEGIPNSKLRIAVLRGHIVDEAIQSFKNVSEGSWATEESFQKLREKLLEKDPIEQWNRLLDDIIKATEAIRHNGNLPPDMDFIKEIFPPKVLSRMMKKFVDEADKLDELLTSELLDTLEIHYVPDSGNEIEINKASYGQQAVEFLKLVLAETGNATLVIDQPEDDLDNEFIQNELLNLIYTTRQVRQIIFSSHNANLVVNGDAGSIVILDRRIEPDGVRLHFKEPIGTIDQNAICEAIKDIMEGGKAAFLLRKKKYSL